MSHVVGMASVPPTCTRPGCPLRPSTACGGTTPRRPAVSSSHASRLVLACQPSRPRMPAGVGVDRSTGCPPAGIVSLTPRSSSPGTGAPISWRPKRFPRTARPHTHGHGDCATCGQTRREGHA
jgi:hypothetical protein